MSCDNNNNNRYSYGDGGVEIDWGSCDESSDDSRNESDAASSTKSLLNPSNYDKASDQPPQGIPIPLDLPKGAYYPIVASNSMPTRFVQPASTIAMRKRAKQPSSSRKRQCSSLPLRVTGVTLHLKSDTVKLRRKSPSDPWKNEDGFEWPVDLLMGCERDLAVQVQGCHGDFVELAFDGSVWQGHSPESGTLTVDRQSMRTLLSGGAAAAESSMDSGTP